MKLRTAINIPISGDPELQKIISAALEHDGFSLAGTIRNILKEHLPSALKKAGVNVKG